MLRSYGLHVALLAGALMGMGCGPTARSDVPEPEPGAPALIDCRPSGPGDQECGPPTAEELKALIGPHYRAPERHTLVMAPADGGRIAGKKMVTWTREYDGVPLLSDVKAVLNADDKWETRWLPELSEPEPVDRAGLISSSLAAAKAGWSVERDQGQLLTRLVYLPEIIEVPEVTPVKNAADVERRIQRYRLTLELVNPVENGTLWLDAYTGEIVRRASGKNPLRVTVPGLHYPSVGIDVTPGVNSSNQLRDPVRYSRLTLAGTPLNGQGVVLGTPANSDRSLAYDSYMPQDPINVDGMFVLQQSWDFFRAAFGRMGLRDLPPSLTTLSNEGVLSFNQGADFNAFMLDDAAAGRASGVILVHAGAPLWQSIITLEDIGHEWSHAVFDADVGSTRGFRSGETGGLDEGNSDFFGKLIRARGRAVLASQSCTLLQCAKPPAIAEIPNTAAAWLFGNEDPTYPAQLVRYMCLPSRDTSPVDGSHSLDMWQPGMAGLDAHNTSGPINRMHCLMVRGIIPYRGASGDPDLRSVFVPAGFPGIGTEKTARIWYAALPYLRARVMPLSFMDARQASLDAATNLYEKYSDEYKAVEDSFAAIAVGAPADRTPPLVKFSRTTVGKNTPIPFVVSDLTGVKSVVVGMDDTTLLANLNGPPWQFNIVSNMTDGPHTITFTATDTRRNSKTYRFPVTADLSPPRVLLNDVTPVSPEYQHKRLYAVTTTDQSAIARIELRVDAIPNQVVFSGAPVTFTVNYDVGGPHYIQAFATDVWGLSTGVNTNVDVDLTPPSFTSAPTYTEDLITHEGRVVFTVCGSDASGFGAAWVYYYLGSQFTAYQQNGCFRIQTDSPVGTHSFRAVLRDKWGNESTRSGTYTVRGILPTVQQPLVALDTSTVGHVSVTATYSAPSGINRVILHVCENGNSPCDPIVEFTAGPGDQTSHIFQVYGLPVGHAYKAVTYVEAKNLLEVFKVSDLFLIPSGTTTGDVVANEVEPNAPWQFANLVAVGANVIRGATSGGDDDWFAVGVPAGKTLCVAAANTNQNTACTTDVSLYVNNQGGLAGGASSGLSDSRAEITSASYVCSGQGPMNNLVYVNLAPTGLSGCGTLAYDILLKFQ